MPDELTGRERVLLALQHQSTDRIPIAMLVSGINPPAYTRLQAYLQAVRHISVEQYLLPLVDIATVRPDYIGPALGFDEDLWGVRRRSVSYGEGAYDEIYHYPLGQVHSAGNLSDHRWPSPDWYDYSSIPAKVRALRNERDRAVIAWIGTIFESSWYMRGFQQFFVDLALDPNLAHGILRRVTDHLKEVARRTLEAGRGEIDLVQTGDDVGHQRGLLMSLGMLRETINPYHTELNDLIHSYGAKVVYHSDGAIMKAVPEIISIGVDVLQALQFAADNMDAVTLKGLYGDRLCFEGGVSVQTTLPFGSVADVQDEVRHLISTLGRNGGYVLGPSHAIQAGTPPENVVAMFDTAASTPMP